MADIWFVVRHPKSLTLVKSCVILDFGRPSVVGLVSKVQEQTLGKRDNESRRTCAKVRSRVQQPKRVYEPYSWRDKRKFKLMKLWLRTIDRCLGNHLAVNCYEKVTKTSCWIKEKRRIQILMATIFDKVLETYNRALKNEFWTPRTLFLDQFRKVKLVVGLDLHIRLYF